MKYNLSNMRPYQIGCVYKLQYDIEHGSKRLFVDMPIGTGKLSTITFFLKLSIKENQRILVINSRKELAQQSNNILSYNLTKDEFDIFSISEITSIDTNINFDNYSYIVIDIDPLIINKYGTFLNGIFNQYTNVIIGLISINTKDISTFISQYGEINFSLSLAELVIRDSNIINGKNNEVNESIETEFIYQLESKSDLIKYPKIKSLICKIICDKQNKPDFKIEANDFIIDVLAILAGFFPLSSIVGFIFKYSYKVISKVVINNLKNELECSTCNIF